MDLLIDAPTQEKLLAETPKDSLAINEIFYSIQGEGKLSGTPMIFVRLNGCSIGCGFCDTKYTWKTISHNKYMTAEQIQKIITILNYASDSSYFQNRKLWICFTGGEPLEQQNNLIEVCKTLKFSGFKLQLETSGSVEIKQETRELFDWISCSPKKFHPLNNTNKVDELKILVLNKRTVYENIERIRNFTKKFQRKIWVCIQPIEPEPFELGNFEGYSENIKDAFMLSVQQRRLNNKTEWTKNKALAIEVCKRTGWQLSIQFHKYLNIR